MSNRRDFLKTLVAGTAGAVALGELARTSPLSKALASSLVNTQADRPWETLYPRILANIKAPTFPKRDFPVTRFGARPDGKTDCSEAFRKAIEACNHAGGGRVTVPAGVFSTGAIRLKSNVNLNVEKGATIKFSQDPRKYLPLVFTRWEGMELMNYSPFIYAFEL